MYFDVDNLAQALDSGLSSPEATDKAKAVNVRLEQGVSNSRRTFFENEPLLPTGNSWNDLILRHNEYARLYVKTGLVQPHTFLDDFEPNDVGVIDRAQFIVRLEGLARPMNAFGCSFDELREAHEDRDVDFLSDFCEVWNENRDFRPAFSTLLSEVTDEVGEDEWADALQDKLGLAHYSPTGPPEPVALCRYSVADVHREATTGFPITMPTVLDSDPWEHYFPAPKSLQFGRAMALTPCDSEEDLKVEFLNSRVTYSHDNIWKVGQIVTPAPSHDISNLRELHLLALQIASGDHTFGT